MHEDFTPEELALVDAIVRQSRVQYGEISIVIRVEAGRRTHTVISQARNIAEKFRPQHPNG